ncbi:MAG: hypothetical protein GF334_06360 [Candidatus Altiarchaeales archaeon]|nr:hypothetical protein [Candidatus Altiarchaeales archaeon]
MAVLKENVEDAEAKWFAMLDSVLIDLEINSKIARDHIAGVIEDLIDAWIICGSKEPNDETVVCLNELAIYRKGIKRLKEALGA